MLNTFGIVVGLLLLVPTLLMYTLGPFLIWRQQKIQAIFTFEPLELQTFLAARNDLFQTHAQNLESLGFVPVGASVLLDIPTESCFGLYWSAEHQLAAMIASIESPVQTVTYLEFSQKYSDGSILNVSNNSILGAYPDTANKITLLCPELTDGAELLAAQQQIRRALVRSDYAAVDYPVAEGFAELEKHLRQEADSLVSRGLAHPEIDTNGKRALTFWGAVVMTYRQLPPWRQLLLFHNRQRARRLLALARLEQP